MSLYTAVLFVHVVAAVVLVGGSLLAPVIRNVICEATSVHALVNALAIDRRTTRWTPLAALVVLASGVYLGSVGWWSQGWFHVSAAAWLANSLLAGLVLHRINTTLARAASEGAGPRVAEIDRLRNSRAWNLSLAAMLANDLAMLYLMFNKPGGRGSVALVIVANVVAAIVFTAVKPRSQAMRLPMEGV